jgi:hypothetical protein
MAAPNRQLTDAEIYAKVNRPKKKRGPKAGYLKRTRPLDGSSLQSEPKTPFDNAVAKNEAQQCAVKGCHRGRFGLSKVCLDQ